MVADRSAPGAHAHGRSSGRAPHGARSPRVLALARPPQCLAAVDLAHHPDHDHERGPAITFSAPGRDTVRIDPTGLPSATSLTIGSHSSCRIRVEGPGVRALHAEIFWDGRALWVGPGMPGTMIDVDGGRLGRWSRVDAATEVWIGPVTARLVPGPRDTILWDDDEATRIAAPREEDIRRTMPYADDAPTLLALPVVHASECEPLARPMLRSDLGLRRDLSERPPHVVRPEHVAWPSKHASEVRADFRTPTPVLRAERCSPVPALGVGFGAPPPESRSALVALAARLVALLRIALHRLAPAR